MPRDTLLKIGELARLTGLPVKTIRFWSDEGLVPPDGRTPAGYRLYGQQAVVRLGLVRTLRELGVDHATIRRVLRRELAIADVAAAHAAWLDVRIRALRLHRAVLQTAAGRGSVTPEEIELMHRLAQLSADERRRLVHEFIDDTFTGLDLGPDFLSMLRGAMPDLPEEPTQEQVGAWVELAELIQDPDFRASIGRAAVDQAHTAAEVGQPSPEANEALVRLLRERVGAAADAGIEPGSAEARPVVDEVAAAWAQHVGRADGPGFRSWLLDRLEASTDRRYERYWQLMAVINGWPPAPRIMPAAEWLRVALRAGWAAGAPTRGALGLAGYERRVHPSPMAVHPTLDEWIARDAIPFALDTPASLDSATDRVIVELGPDVELLALGEALHGSEEILLIRNRMFQRLVEKHGYSAVVIEVTSPQARAINEYVLGGRERSDPKVEDWFGNGFGLLEANRELVEWLRQYNADASHPTKLHFYGFDLPLGQGGLASPSRVLDIALGYLETVDPARGKAHRDRITAQVGDLSEWERPAAMFDPAQSIGLTPKATHLRIATLDLITDLRIRRPEYAAKTDPLAYADALHYAELGRKLLDAHAALANPGAYATMLGVRDLIMADNLQHFVACETGRGKVLAFAASGHLKRGTMQWHLPPGDDVKEWWPAGSQLTQAMGPRYAVIGMALGVSEPNGIAPPEPGTLEATLAAAGGSMLLPTHRGRGVPAPEVERAPARSGSKLNPTYSWLTPDSFSDFEWLVFLDSTAYPRGGPSLSDWNAG